MDNWHIFETQFNNKNNRSLETVYTIGNGYLGTRGTFEEGYPGDQPATLINGFFDDIPIVFTELANTPNWLDLQITANGERLNLKNAVVTDYFRDLNLHNGELTRTLHWEVAAGGHLALEFQRFTSLADEHIVALRCQVKSIDFSGDIEFHSGLSGYADNEGFLHLEWIEQGKIDASSAYLQVETRKTHHTLVEAFSLNLTRGKSSTSEFCDSRMNPFKVEKVHLEPGQEAEIEKIVAIYTSLDASHPKKSAIASLQRAKELGYTALLAQSSAEWQKEWNASNISIQGDDEADRAVRYAIYQLLIAAPRKNEHVSIPAKSLSGFGYKGHVFWDTEVFMLPFFTYTQPKIARRLLMYRYFTLPAARNKANSNNYEGAQFAWESAATGEENTPRWVPLRDGNLVRIWCGDIEHHITSDIAFAIQQYWRVTGDNDFMRNFGAEIILETARFWNSRAEWDEPSNRYHINNVIGPDEYHDRIDNNAYTNNMARWNIQFGLEILEWLKKDSPAKADELEQRLELTPPKLDHWRHVIDHLYLGFDPQTGLYEQFEGFFKRQRVDLATFEPRTESMQAILGIEKTQEFQILKQPDVLMLLYLMNANTSKEILERNFAFYTPVTDSSYGSSLGPPIQAILATRVGDVKTAYDLFRLSAKTDLVDVRGNSGDGIHIATQGGLWQAVIFGFCGLEMTPDGPLVHPKLPPKWKRVQFNILIKGKKYEFDIRPEGKANRNAVLPVQGAIFDLDGVLTDTSELHYRAWKRLADEAGIPFTRADNEFLRGIPRRESLLRILKGRKVSEEKLQEMMERKNQYYVESISLLTKRDLLPGARSLLDSLKTAGIKIGLGSASRNALLVVEKLGIASLFDAIADGASVVHQKPAPDLFLHVAGLLGVSAEYCAVFEDAAAGIEAARAGGMWAIGIGPHERLKNAHWVYPGLNEISVTDLLDRLSGMKKD
ncbi:beta-phosphoglucomutase [Longilinea arvoryzae]|uniref:Beta-phosphoglucomutase n=1 Tax=Longilinea arvoryzae TaxID=360412 RepID=A0A0S7BKJ3_9CHLR|nr:beta-phosphoglucomutase [Longilinea arvoryzae]GAP14341.1 beta-phosphoglucomutase [Longilinea arvoryzae]